jgi:diaminopimelate decarboxylase
MGLVDSLVEKYFGVRGSDLYVGGFSVRQIAEQFGTPLFVYDAAGFDAKWNLLRRTFPDRFAIYYSVKANPNRAILRRLLAHGAGLEIASMGELEHAIGAGCRPERILFAGPGKTEAELEMALKQGIGEIHVESFLEARRIGEIGRRLGVKARVALRINPSDGSQGGAMRMGGKPAAFGVDEERCDEVIEYMLAESAMEFCGIHLFAGTQILDRGILLNQYRKGIELAKRISTLCGRPLMTIDFGGGLGIPYFPHERDLDMELLAKDLNEFMADVERDPSLEATRFVVEPGRYLVGEAGLYVTRVNDVKVSRGKTFVILDGGMHHHLAASGNLGQVIKRNFPIGVANRMGHPVSATVDLVGPLCTPLDTLAKDLPLPPVEVGDLVVVFQSGAYARTASPMGFLSHPSPPEIMVAEGQMTLIRSRGTYERQVSDA